MTDFIKEIKLLGNEADNLFNSNDKYIVPLYQRAYSWSFKEIEQLIDDLMDFSEDEYYLGSLIVYKRNDCYEVIDGQQRLTTLYILFDVLKNDFLKDVCNNFKSLAFECRDKSNYTLDKYYEKEFDEALLEKDILDGKDIIFQKIKREQIDVDKLIEQIKKVIIYRIEVPKHTDLNRYFEIMNTRGEQLEQTDILKAKLMEPLNDSERNAFAVIWDACSDMTGYVQMHFKPELRTKLFYSHWDWLNEDELNGYMSNAADISDEEELTVKEALLSDSSNSDYDGLTDKDERVRFDSIIEFPYFLQHVLKVLVSENDIISNDGEKIVPEQLDDKKLLDNFTRVLEKGTMNDSSIDYHLFSVEFIKCLLKSRYLFDKYIIKREHSVDDIDGEWSIKALYSKDKKATYVNTRFRLYEQNKGLLARNKKNVMIQSCLRVSYVSPKTMHWITELLKVLYKRDRSQIEVLYSVGEVFARTSIKRDYLDKCEALEPIKYEMGVDTPHIVFNYLDYLLWKNYKEFNDFSFEFRNSVEHWHPQHPSESSFKKWEDGIDTFGNLCIIQRNVNSKFSNMSPEAKESTYKEMIAKGSLKLRLMAKETRNNDGWTKDICTKHETAMIDMLKNDINQLLILD